MAGIRTYFEIILARIEINFKFVFGGNYFLIIFWNSFIKKNTLMSIEYLFILIYIVG